MSDTERGETHPDERPKPAPAEPPANDDDERPAPAGGGAMPDTPPQGDEVDPGLG